MNDPTAPSIYKQTILILEELGKAFPRYSLGRHIAIALQDYHDVWGITDREMVYALSKYKAELSLDVQHGPNDIEKIIQDGMNLDTLFIDNDNDDDYND